MAEGSEGLAGVQFPADEAGRRSTSAAGRAVFAAAATAVDADLAASIRGARRWHEDYASLLHDLVRAELLASVDDPEAVPRAGLDAITTGFAYHRDGAAVPLAHATGLAPAIELTTARVTGEGARRTELVVPYRGRDLTGDELRRQLVTWVDGNVIEPSVAAAVETVLAQPDWLDLSDLTFVVLGAGAEMGPLEHLLAWGATVAPVDVVRPRVWERILGVVRAGAGTALVPVRHDVDPADGAALAVVAGADLDTELPELTNWLARLDAVDVIGTYVYADGADNVRVSLAADTLAVHLSGRHPDATLAGLLTPTDVYAAPPEAADAATRGLASAGPPRRLASRISGRRAFRPHYDGVETTPGGVAFGIADAQVLQQGPNYALAKRLARWRFRQARADGTPVSANVAPATSTRSVTSNRLLAAAYRGAHHFGVEVFAPATSTALMAALLVRDLRDPKAAGRPETELTHPLALFADTAAHGGLWRLPWAPRSVLPMAAVLGLPSTLRKGT